jgi:hypothetical protein
MKADRTLYFRRGYKYVVKRDCHGKLDIIPFAPIDVDHMRMDMEGNATILAGYPWNGASGPTWDTLSSMRGSLWHDFCYELIRLGLIDRKYKEYADQLLHDLCTEDGMYSWRADYWRWAVLKFGAGSCLPSAEPKEEVAP